ncbi:MAG: hypothetical protein FWF84_03430 [Kiritimatiellaeota bacterium]|nr:hypothetical protein [Kiritimatiellota bacterium]
MEKTANVATDLSIDTQQLDKDIPYFTLVEMAEQEQDLEKRKALFEFSNTVLEREFMKCVKRNEQNSASR